MTGHTTAHARIGGAGEVGAHDHLFVHADTVVHRLPAQVKLVAALTFVAAVVSTDRERVWVFAIHALIVVVAITAAKVPRRRAVVQLFMEGPVLLFALALPFVATGSTTTIGPLTMATEGLWGAWNIVAKATLGVGAMMVVAATTPVAELLVGLRRLRTPVVLVAVASFMLRYLDIIQSELHRVSIARVSRGDDPRWFWQARAVAGTAGTMFVRSFERGERVHLAMRARGFSGEFPDVAWRDGPRPIDWALALAMPAAAWVAVVFLQFGLAT